MTQLLFTNGAASTLASSITNVDTSITVSAADGTLFPDPGAEQAFYVTLENVAGDIEVLLCTSRTGDLLTVTRAQDNTVAQAWNAGDRVELRLTAAVINELLQRDGDTLQGNLGLGSNVLYNGTIRGSELDDTWQFQIPTNGSRPTLGPSGRQILLAPTGVSDSNVDDWVIPAGFIGMWAGAVGTVPDGWRICDGTNGTPDLRDKFIMAPADYSNIGSTGDGTGVNTGAGGNHNHGGTTGAHALTTAQIPSHRHNNGVGDNGTKAFVYGGTAEDMPGGAVDSLDTFSIVASNQGFTSFTGSGNSHTHGISLSGTHTHTIPNYTPRFYALGFIQKATAT